MYGRIARETVWFGSATFGPPCIIACYASTIRGATDLWVPIVMSLATILAVHAAWWFAYGQWLRVFEVWHGTSTCILDLTLLFILSQSLSYSRDSPMHSPTEFSYAPVILAIIVASSILIGAGEDGKRFVIAAHSWAFKITTLLLGVASFFIICAYRPGRELHTLSFPSGQGGWQALLLITTLLYAMPQADSPHRGYSTYIVALLKCVVLSVGMLLLDAKRVAPNEGMRLHDYYALRVITNDDPHLAPPSLTPVPITMYTSSVGKIFTGIFLKAYCTLSVCLWMSRVKCGLFRWASDCKVSHPARGRRYTASKLTPAYAQVNMVRHVHDLHELYIVYALTCILLALFSASRENVYTGSRARGEYTERFPVHSMGILWGMLLTTGMSLAVGAVCAFRFLL